MGKRLGQWLAGRGAPRVVLTSRSGPATPGIARLAAKLVDTGTHVTVSACDIAERVAATRLLAQISAGGPPLTAVMHAAGAPSSVALQDTSVADIAGVMEARAVSAALLDELTAGLDLDAFVLFSSEFSAWGGNQFAGCAAADAYLDALAQNRRARGLSATSVTWGPWGDDGTAAEEPKVPVQPGVRPLDPGLAMRALGQALDDGEDFITLADVDWARFGPVFTLHRPSPLIAGLPEVRQAPADADPATQAPHEPATDAALARRLADLSRAEQEQAVIELVQAEAGAVLGYSSPSDIGPESTFKDLGVESATAVELRNRLSAVTGLTLPATLVFDYPTSAVLAAYLRNELCQDGEMDAAGVLNEIDRLEAALSQMSVESSLRTSIEARLRSVLSRWIDARQDQEESVVANRLDSATADEVLNFIENELGMS
jgi:acyl carrier protein